MRVIADLHVHSRYSRATSEKMCPKEIVRFAMIKGLNLVDTGDFTHPKWLKELEETLVHEPNASLYKIGRNILENMQLAKRIKTKKDGK